MLPTNSSNSSSSSINGSSNMTTSSSNKSSISVTPRALTLAHPGNSSSSSKAVIIQRTCKVAMQVALTATASRTSSISSSSSSMSRMDQVVLVALAVVPQQLVGEPMAQPLCCASGVLTRQVPPGNVHDAAVIA